MTSASALTVDELTASAPTVSATAAITIDVPRSLISESVAIAGTDATGVCGKLYNAIVGCFVDCLCSDFPQRADDAVSGW